MARKVAMLVLSWAACGHGSSGTPAPDRRDGAVAVVARDAAPLELESQPLGLSDEAAFGWRKRAGHTAYHAARRAEARGDWPAVVTACQNALAADPGHLEAAWLLAIGLAKTGKPGEVLSPLQLAEAGDYTKWGPASLEHPALAAFRDTPVGDAWRRAVARDQQRLVAMLAHAIVVLAGGDLYAVDPDAPRWLRLSHTYGAVVAAYRPPRVTSSPLLAYITRTRNKKDVHFSIGFVDLATGHATAPIDLRTADPIHVAWSTKTGGIVVKTKSALLAFDGAGKSAPAPPHADDSAAIAGGTWFDVTPGRHGTIRHGELGSATKADWDDRGLASAMKLTTSGRIVAVASPGLIDGYTVAWSRDRSHVAFVAQLDDHCTGDAANTAAFVADASTGALVELARAKRGIAVEWVGDARLAVAGDGDVVLAETSGAAKPITGADSLVTPRVRPRCLPDTGSEAPATEEEPAEPGSDDPR